MNKKETDYPISFDSKDFEDFIDKTIKRFKEIQLKEMTTFANLLTWAKNNGKPKSENIKFLCDRLELYCDPKEFLALKDCVENWRKSEDDPENGTYIDETTKEFKKWYVVSQKQSKTEGTKQLKKLSMALLRVLDFNMVSEFASNEGGNPKVIDFLGPSVI